jgi:hypothetical protein
VKVTFKKLADVKTTAEIIIDFPPWSEGKTQCA